MLLAGSPAHFSNKNSFTPPSFVVQWSSPLTAAVGLLISFITSPVLMISIDRFNAIGLDDLRPFRDLGVHESLEFGLCHHKLGCAGLFPGLLGVGPAQNLVDLVVKLIHDRFGCACGRHEAHP